MSLASRIRVTNESTHATTGVIDTARARAIRSRLMDALSEQVGHERLFDIASRGEETARAELGVELDRLLTTEEFVDVLAEEGHAASSRLVDDIVGYGPLQALMDDPSITEIMVNGPDHVFFERDGHVLPSQDRFDDERQIRHVVDRIIAPLGRRLDERSPLVNARLANGYRINAVIPPVAIDGTTVTIRKFKERITSLGELIALGSMDVHTATLLRWAVMSRKNIAVVGGTGSGKTTLLNALSSEIDHSERIITIEDSAELRFSAHPHVVRLERREPSIEGVGEVSIRDLVINALRMRPDRIIVGECRGAEALDMLQAMNTGHDGSLTTLHAGSAEEAVLRLIMMSRYAMELPTQVIEGQIASAIDFFVVQGRLTDGTRIISQVSECSRDTRGRVLLSPCIDFDRSRRTWSHIHEPSFVSEMLELGSLSAEEVGAWRSQLS